MTCGKIISPAGVSVVMIARWSIVLIRQSIASMIPKARCHGRTAYSPVCRFTAF
jgi:hypothetical protein